MAELQNKTPTYLDGSRSNFPDDVDKIPEKRDLPPNMKPKARRFQELVNKDTLTSTEQEELNNLTIELYEFLPTAEDWNKAFDMSIATQKHYKDNTINHVNQLKQETTDFVNEKKSEITTYTDNMKNDVTTHTATEKQKISNIADNNVREVVNAKDEALLSIERKKDAIIEFLDGTDIGELRVDVGVMDELETEDKSSLVGAVNEVNKQVSEPKYVSTTSYDNVVSMPDGSTNGQVSASVKGLSATNLVRNGNFANGTTGWAMRNCTTTFIDDVIQVDATGAYSRVYQNLGNFTVGDKYYMKSTVKPIENCLFLRIQLGNIENYSYVVAKTVSEPEVGKWYDLSGIIDISDQTTLNAQIGVESSFNAIYQIKKTIMVINLTQTFGAGNEPTVEQCDKIFANYFDGTKSTISAMKVKSVGKNLFDGEFLSLGTRWSSSTSQKFPTVAQDNNISSKLVTIPDGVSQIRIIYNASQNGVYFYDKEGYYVNRNFYSDNFNGISSIPTGAKYVGVNFREINNIQEAKDANLYISTDLKNETYEPYKEDTSYVLAKQDNKIVTLMSLPNGTKDEIRVSGGNSELIKRVSDEYTDFSDWQWSDEYSNGAFYRTATYLANGNVNPNGLFYNNEGLCKINTKYAPGGDVMMALVLTRDHLISNGYTADGIGARRWAIDTGLTLIYQLAEPEIIPIRWTGLQGYENGTLYFDTIIPEIGVYYNSGLQTHYLDHPIASIDTLYKVDKETGLRTSLDVSKCILAEDKLSFTHPDLIDGDLVDWDYVPTTESTNGEKTITASTNMSAAVDSLLKDSQTQKENIRQANSRLDNCDNKINNQEDKINNLTTIVNEHKANMIKFNRNPTSDDINYDTGQLWFNEDTGNIYVLFKIDKDGSAIWRGVNNADLIYPLKIYGVRIDMNNSNPLTSVVYTDDAVNMTPAPVGGGASEWDSVYPYSEIKPCLLKNGEIQTYLNSSNLAQKADGTPADITTGDNGDVMVEFPVIYWKIWREGQYLYVKYANYKIDSTWKALAHTKGSTLKDNIYVGAFLGYELNGKLRSLSGKTVTANKAIGDFRLLAQANGGGYSQMPYFAVLMLQILYLVKYKSRDSQTALGRGFVDGNSADVATGGTNTKGVDFGETTGKQQMKFLNIEDFWGNYYYWLDGLVTDSSYNLLYSNDNFNDAGVGYEKFTTGLSANIFGYIDDVWGSTETGFIIKSKNGSTTTHFCDYGNLYSGRVACFGGHWNNGSDAGFARLRLDYSASDAYSNVAARLFYA